MLLDDTFEYSSKNKKIAQYEYIVNKHNIKAAIYKINNNG
jgi:hypothetical protein